MIDKFCDMRICAVFHLASLGELVARCVVVRSWQYVSWQHIRPDIPYRPRTLQFSALANSFPKIMLWKLWF